MACGVLLVLLTIFSLLLGGFLAGVVLFDWRVSPLATTCLGIAWMGYSGSLIPLWQRAVSGRKRVS